MRGPQGGMRGIVVAVEEMPGFRLAVYYSFDRADDSGFGKNGMGGKA